MPRCADRPARAAARRTVWERIAARHGVIGIRLDASIVDAHSPKAQAAGTFGNSFVIT